MKASTARLREYLAAGALLVLAGGANAAGPAGADSSDSYPEKPIRMVVPFAAGGGSDIVGRILAQQLGIELGRTVVVDNRPGAGSTIGADIVAKAPADGYTVLLGNISMAFNASLYKKLPYDAIRDLAPVSEVADQPNIVVIHPALPAKTVAEFAALARAKPGELTFASAGTGSGTHFAGELLRMKLGIDMIHIPYKGTGPALTDLIGGQVSMFVSTFASALPHVQAGRLRALGVTTRKRSPAVPDVPSIAEAGVAGYDVTIWYGIFTTGGTPKPVVEKLNAGFVQALKSADVVRELNGIGLEPVGNPSAEFAASVRSEIRQWGEVIRRAGIKPE